MVFRNLVHSNDSLYTASQWCPLFHDDAVTFTFESVVLWRFSLLNSCYADRSFVYVNVPLRLSSSICFRGNSSFLFTFSIYAASASFWIHFPFFSFSSSIFLVFSRMKPNGTDNNGKGSAVKWAKTTIHPCSSRPTTFFCRKIHRTVLGKPWC